MSIKTNLTFEGGTLYIMTPDGDYEKLGDVNSAEVLPAFDTPYERPCGGSFYWDKHVIVFCGEIKFPFWTRVKLFGFWSTIKAILREWKYDVLGHY